MAKKKSILVNVVFSVIIILLLFKLGNINLGKLWAQIKATDMLWFAFASLAFYVQVFTNAYRWNILTKLLDYPVKYLRSVSWYFQGVFSNCFIPTNFGGDALRAYFLGKDKKDWLRAAGTVVVERIIGFIVMIGVIPISLIFLYFSVRYEEFPDTVVLSSWALFLAAMLGVLTYKLWSRIPIGFIEKIRYSIEEYTKCHKSLNLVFVWTMITHIFLIAANIFAGISLGVGIGDIPIWYWFLVIPVATLTGFVVPAMKGLGAKEASYVYLLSLIGVEPEKSLAIAFVVYIAGLMSGIPGGFGIVAKMQKHILPKELPKEVPEELLDEGEEIQV